jgi:hypothetical protein
VGLEYIDEGASKKKGGSLEYLDDAPKRPASKAAVSPKSAAKTKREDSDFWSKLPTLVNPYAAMGDAALSMGSGMLAKPLSEIAGLAATGKEMVSPTPEGLGGGDPAGFQKSVREALTRRPVTSGGQMLTGRYNPLSMLGRGVDWMGNQAQKFLMPPDARGGPVSDIERGVARGVGEAVKQAPNLAGPALGKLAPKVESGVRNTAKGLMQSAVKPPLNLSRTGKAQRGIATLLKEDVNPTEGGMKVLQGRIDAIRPQIDALINNAKGTIKKADIKPYVDQQLKKFMEQVNSASDVRAVQKAWDGFMKNPMIPASSMSPKMAQRLKTGTYRQLKDKAYGEMKSADIEAQKALARGLKEEIEKVIPQVRPLNVRESQLLNALSLTERRVLMSANKDPVGLGIFASNIDKFVGWMANRSDLFKSLVARMLYRGAPDAGAMTRIGAPLGGMAMGSQPQPPQGLTPPPQQQQPPGP